MCYCSGRNDLIYRIDGDTFRGYAGHSAATYPLIHVTSPPAPVGWNLPGYSPDTSWVVASEIWWGSWADPGWKADTLGCPIAGLVDAHGLPEAQDRITHLLRRGIDLAPPAAGMRITNARLVMWSDNKSAWRWQGELISTNKEAIIGEVDLLQGGIEPEGGSYTLAIQNSNDFTWGKPNPQGTGYRLCVVWEHLPHWHNRLPLVLK